MNYESLVQSVAGRLGGLNVNPKIFQRGDLVYYPHRDVTYSGRIQATYKIHFGIVAANYVGYIEVRRLVPKDRRLVNGIPYKDFDTKTIPQMSFNQYQKWLKEHPGESRIGMFCDESEEPCDGFDPNARIDDKDKLLHYYELGFLEELDGVDQSYLAVDESGGGEMQLVKRIDDKLKMSGIIYVPFDQCFASYADAEKYATGSTSSEIKDCSEKDDLYWSVFEIEQTLLRWGQRCHKSTHEVSNKRRFLLNRKDLEDIDVTIMSGELVWRKSRDMPWMAIA